MVFSSSNSRIELLQLRTYGLQRLKYLHSDHVNNNFAYSWSRYDHLEDKGNAVGIFSSPPVHTLDKVSKNLEAKT